MCLRFLRIIAALGMLFPTAIAQQPPLKVCADPENLPFSNRRQQGFENRLAELVALGLNRKLEYRWARHTGRGFVRNILNEGECDLLLSVPQGFRPVLTTSPYYRSGYVFVTPAGREVRSFDDDALRRMKIGVQVVEEEYAPPAIALGRRGLIGNMVGYEAIGKDSGNIVRAVANGELDVAIVWGPLAGYYAHRYGKQLRITPAPPLDAPGLPLSFAISMGVRKSDVKLREEIEQVLSQKQDQIEKILDRYGVPRFESEGAVQANR